MREKEKRVKVFDENAVLYDKYRPGYPVQVVNDIIELSRIRPGDKILEIGCGTGQITIDFLKRGYELLGIEKGESLSKIAERNIKGFKNGQIINKAFEDWETKDKFKLVISAQAFHWIDKGSGTNKILEILDNNGSIGLVWSIDDSRETEFYKETNSVYDKYFPPEEAQIFLLDTVNEYEDYLKNRKDLNDLIRKEYPSEKLHTKDEYLGLLKTSSAHMTLPEENRVGFFREITTIIENHGNQVKRFYRTVLLFARKRN